MEEIEQEQEIWKDIEGFEGKYQVSNFGNVRSLNYNHTGKILLLKQSMGKRHKCYGYKSVMFRKNGKRKWYSVHRLVVEAFLGKIPEGMIINHKDENSSNNKVDNLEICNHSYNALYGTGIERNLKTRKENMKCNREKPIYAIKNGNREWFKSRCECARQLDINRGAIHRVLKGERSHHHGYQFEYAPEENDQ